MAIRLRSVAATAGVYFLFAIYGCSGSRQNDGVVITDDPDFFAPAPVTNAASADESFDLLLFPSVEPLRLLLVADLRDQLGSHYYPNVQLQFRAWNDDTVTAWMDFEMTDFVVIQDTIIIHLDALLVADARLQGCNFLFRARLISAGVVTDWVRTKQSIRFYDSDRRKGIPRQPKELRIIH